MSTVGVFAGQTLRGISALLLTSALAAGCDDEGLPPPSDVLADSEGDEDEEDGDDDDAHDDDDDDSHGDDDDDDDDDDSHGDDDDDDVPPGDDDDDDDDDVPPGDDDDDDVPPGDDDDDDDSEPTETCDDNQFNLAPYGWAEASSEFSGWFSSYPADLSIDGSIGTSWFSAGPEEDGTQSTYEFILMHDHCMDEIEIIGNAAHENTDFQIGYGYEWVTVEIRDTANDTVFLEEYSMEGSPDPTLTIDTGGVLGHRVILHWSGHESNDCGGFSELVVNGRSKL